MTGKTISNYKIISKIGEGGMGSVYLAEHISLKRRAAVKVLNPEFKENKQLKDRFHNEALTLSKLTHQNIVILYDLTELSGNLYLIMEYVEGETIDNILNKTGHIHEKRSAVIFEQILEGVSYAHKRGIIHRDLKPSNIILQKDDTPKILDFGIAKILESDVKLTKTGTRMGSVLYMSPEQILGNVVDLRSDIYSLGVTLYEMLCGTLPYDSDTESEFQIQNRIVNEPLTSFRSVNSNVSEHLENVVYKATSKDPSKRFQSCQEFIDALKNDSFRTSTVNTRYDTEAVKTKYESVSPASSTNLEQSQTKLILGMKPIVFGIAALIIVSLIIVIAIVVSNSDNDSDTKYSDKITKTSTETKKESSISSSDQNYSSKNETESYDTDESQEIKMILNNWLNDTNGKSYNIGKYYASRLNYYTWKNTSKSKAMNDKKQFFNKWDYIDISENNLSVKKINDYKYQCIFDKTFKVEDIYGNKQEGMVQSKIVFEKEDSEWLITNETDIKTYYLDK